MQYIQLI